VTRRGRERGSRPARPEISDASAEHPRRSRRFRRALQAVKLLIVDELGYLPLWATGAELLFETFSQRYERGSTIITSNLPAPYSTGSPITSAS